jgi:hypothetical protein
MPEDSYQQVEQVEVVDASQDPVQHELAAAVALDAPDPGPGGGAGDGSSGGGRHRRGRWWWALRIVTGVAGVAILAVALVFAVSRLVGEASGRPGNASPSRGRTAIARVPFEFALPGVSASSFSGRRADNAVRLAGEQARVILSGWYDAAYFDPASWKQGPPASAWSLFAPTVVRQAKATDAPALSLGPVDGLTDVTKGKSRLYVRVLLDPSLHPLAMVATVSLDATGSLKDGNLLQVSNHASFLFRIQNGRWKVVAYPTTETKLKEVPRPSQTPVPGPTSSASASAAA